MTRSFVQRSTVVRLAREPVTAMSGARLARLVNVTEDGAIVECGGGARLARSLVEATQLQAINGREVLVLFVGEGWDEPVIVGIVQPPVAAAVETPPPAPALPSVAPSDLPAEAVVDGKRVVIRGAEEISFHCGESSIVMSADGRIVVRGNHVETRARRLNRIRGGSVKIN